MVDVFSKHRIAPGLAFPAQKLPCLTLIHKVVKLNVDQ